MKKSSTTPKTSASAPDFEVEDLLLVNCNLNFKKNLNVNLEERIITFRVLLQVFILPKSKRFLL